MSAMVPLHARAPARMEEIYPKDHPVAAGTIQNPATAPLPGPRGMKQLVLNRPCRDVDLCSCGPSAVETQIESAPVPKAVLGNGKVCGRGAKTGRGNCVPSLTTPFSRSNPQETPASYESRERSVAIRCWAADLPNVRLRRTGAGGLPVRSVTSTYSLHDTALDLGGAIG